MRRGFLLIAAAGLSLAAAASEKKIFGHYMGCLPFAGKGCCFWPGGYTKYLRESDDFAWSTGGRWVNWPLVPHAFSAKGDEAAAAEIEIRRAIRAGLDGFAVDAWAGRETCRHWLDVLFAAAERMGVKFELTICLDPDCHGGYAESVPMWRRYADSVRRLLDRHGASPCLARFGGKPLVITYHAWQICGKDGWDRLDDRLADAGADWGRFREAVGEPVFLHGCVDALPGIFREDAPYGKIGAWAAKTFDAGGLFFGRNGPNGGLRFERRLADVVRAGGKPWCNPLFFQYDQKWSQVYSQPGLDIFCRAWEYAIVEDPPLMQFTTWNDYGEETNLAPSSGTGYTLLRLNRYYVEWWKTGRRPVIAEDEIHAVYRRALGRDARPMKTRGFDVPEVLEVLTLLKAPARVAVEGYGEYEAPAGMFRRQFPLKAGRIRIAAFRDGAKVRELEPPEPVALRRWREDPTLVAFGTGYDDEWRKDFPGFPVLRWNEMGDDDGDGLPNWFEMLYFGAFPDFARTTSADPSADPDGDGRTNLQELRDGSDPTVFDGARRGVNVRVFGAVGDGVHDDTAALQRAADSVAMDGRPGHERAWMCTRNISNTMSDSPCTELYFPPGTYRITGPVAFNFNTTLRGENATIVNATTNEVSFYFEQALRIDIEGLSFAGGATHVRHWSNNRDTATCLIRNCTFRGASDVAFVTDAYREETGVRYGSRAEEMAAGVNRRTCSAMVLSRDGDRVRLVPRDPKTFVPWENSTNFILDGCRFLGNGRAVDIRSDGCVIRNCRFVAPSGASKAQVELGVRAHLYGCEIGYRAPRAAAAVVCHSGNFGFEDCRIGSDAPLAAVRYLDPPAPGYIASSLTVRNVRLAKAVSPLLSFAEGAFPNKVTADGVTGSAGEAFGFDRVPSRDDLAAWLRGRRHPDLGPALSYGISLSRLGEMADNLPDVFVRYRHDIPVSVWKDVAWPSAGTSASGRRMEFGGETVVVSNTIVLADGMRVIGRGRALLKAADDSFPVFRVPKGAKVRIENVSVWRGRHAVEVEGDGEVEAVNCAFYDQLGATFRAPAGTVRTFGGIAYTPFLYDGAGLAFFEALWFSCLPDHPDKGYRNRDYAAIRVGEGGRLFVRDLLGVPCYFRHVMPMHDIWRKRPAADQIGDFRWIDSRGEVVLQHCRFGGEWGGLTPVYQRGAAAKTYLEGPYFCVDCPRLRDSRAVMRIDSPSDPVLVDSVTTLYSGTYADRAHCVFPFRHEEKKAGK